MKLLFKKGDLDTAPKDIARVLPTEEGRGINRVIRQNGVDTLFVGTSDYTLMNARRFVILCRSIIKAAKANKFRRIALQYDRTPALFKQLERYAPEYLSQIAAENFEMANYEHNAFKTPPKDGWGVVEEVHIYGDPPVSVIRAAVKGQEIGKAANACRELANTPAGDLTPTILARRAREAVQGLPVKAVTLGRSEMKKLGMGALLGVAKGSMEEPTFTILDYRGAKSAPIVLAGKGVTFDSGGLNLKPSTSIYEMHMDMSGAAAVIHAVALAARLKLKKRVIGLIPSVENMPGHGAYRPGDVLRSMSGKTIEVLDTDAEGRLILADTITYAKRFKPSIVLDVATLTGAALSALGLYASALLTRDDEVAELLLDYGEASGDYLWRLPLWDEYEDRVKGTFADLANVMTGSTGRYGGAIDGGMFLWQFAKELDCPWAHLDIAPKMTAAPGEELAKGAAGAPVRLLARFIEKWIP